MIILLEYQNIKTLLQKITDQIDPKTILLKYISNGKDTISRLIAGSTKKT